MSAWQTLKAMLSLAFFSYLVVLRSMLESISKMVKFLKRVLIKMSLSILPKSQGKKKKKKMDLDSWRMTFMVAVHIFF